MKLVCTIILSLVILAAADRIARSLESVCPESEGISFIES